LLHFNAHVRECLLHCNAHVRECLLHFNAHVRECLLHINAHVRRKRQAPILTHVLGLLNGTTLNRMISICVMKVKQNRN
jgi:hypothetical protein